jgi:hypothetical protein
MHDGDPREPDEPVAPREEGGSVDGGEDPGDDGSEPT